MDFIAENMAAILAVVTSICGTGVAIVSFVKMLKSEKRTVTRLVKAETDVKITREGIVQGFKEAIVTKDLKISINKQVEKILTEYNAKLVEEIRKNEERRTKMMYWCLKTLDYTAAADKLTVEQKAEINELLAMIADEEQIVDTTIV